MIGQIKEAFNMLVGKLEGWLNHLILILPNAILAIIVMIIVFFASNYIKSLSKNGLRKVTGNESIISLFSAAITFIFVAIGIFLTLSILQLDKAVTSLLAGAGVIGLAVGLAFQEPIINTISGIVMSFKDLYNIGDLVETGDYLGKIEEISLRYTILRTLDGQKVIMPNKMLVQDPLKNYSISGERRVVLECGISYGEDLERVKSISLDAIKNGVEYDEQKGLQFFYTEYGASSINFRMHIWMKDNDTRQPKFMELRSDSIIALKKAFDKNDIMIPFPIRTLDFGIKGGEKLSAMIADRMNPSQGNGSTDSQEQNG